MSPDDRQLLAGAYQEEAVRLRAVAQHLPASSRGGLQGLPSLKNHHALMAEKMTLESQVSGDQGLKVEGLRHLDRASELERIRALYGHPKNGHLSQVIESVDRFPLMAHLLLNPAMVDSVMQKANVGEQSGHTFIQVKPKVLHARGRIPALFSAKVSAAFKQLSQLKAPIPHWMPKPPFPSPY